MSPTSVPQPPSQPPQISSGKVETVLVMTAAIALGGAAVSKPAHGETKIERLTKVSVGIAAASFALLILDQAVPAIALPMAWLMLATIVLFYKGQPFVWIAKNFVGK